MDDKGIIEQKLHNYFQIEVQAVEPSREWWDNAISHLGEPQCRRRRFGFIPRTRLAWALLPLILLLLGGTVYGATSIIQSLFHKWATGVEEAGLAQELNLSQTVDGITVRLERAYADSNVVLLGFTVNGPKARYYADAGKLSTADGQSLYPMIGMGVMPGSDISDIILGSWDHSERAAIITAFDASSVQGAPSELNLRLETSVADSAVHREDQAPVGPFTFDFKVPFHSGKVIDIGQTVEAAGVPVTLEQVVISPGATRVVFSFAPSYGDSKNTPLLITSLQPANGDSINSSLGRVKETSSAEYGLTTPYTKNSANTHKETSSEQYFNGDFTSHHGEWTVTVNELVFPGPPVELGSQKGGTHPASDTKRLAGPWVFHFQVP